MARRKRGYKVVRLWKGRLVSSLVSVAPALRDYEVEYGIGVPAIPRCLCGPLCAYSHIRAARDLACSVHDRIYKCSYVKSVHRSVWVDNMRRVVHRNRLPKHTVLADEVTLLGKPIT